MFSLWEISTDSVVTALIVVCISALAIAWLFAGRRRPAKEGSLENRRLAGREAEVVISSSAPAVETDLPDLTSEETIEEVMAEAPQVEAPLTTPLEIAEHQRDVEADAPSLSEPAAMQPPANTQTPPAALSAEQKSAMSIAAALVRHDKREAAPSTPHAREIPLENISTGGDDLTAINGIDHTLAKEMNDLGIRYFDQIVAWSPDYAAWVTSRLSSSVTNAQRADWVAEAKALIEQPAPTDRNHAERAG